MNASLKTAIEEWLNDERYTIFATLAFHPSKAPNKAAAIGAGSNVLNRLDHTVLSKRDVREGLRVPRAVVYQEGAGGMYPHLHVLLSDTYVPELSVPFPDTAEHK